MLSSLLSGGIKLACLMSQLQKMDRHFLMTWFNLLTINIIIMSDILVKISKKFEFTAVKLAI